MQTNQPSNIAELAQEDETSTIGKLLEKKRKIEQSRVAYERQWITSIAFLFGKHYFVVEKRQIDNGDLLRRVEWELKDQERKSKTRRTVNYILPLYRSLLARMLSMKSHINAEPLTKNERDISSAKVAQEALEDFWINANSGNPYLQKTAGMTSVMKNLFSYLLSMGHGYLKPYFNPDSPAKTYLANEVVDGQAGQVETDVLHPFQVVFDPQKRFAYVQKIMSVEQIENLYGVEVKPEEISMTDYEKELLSLLEGRTDVQLENCAKIFEYWEVPCKKYPQGRLICFVEKKILIDTIIPPEYKGKIPLFEFNYLDIPLSPFAQGAVEQLIPSQEDYNFTVSRIYGYKKWFTGKIKVPDGCDLRRKYDDEIGQLIQYNPLAGEPHFEQAPQAPAQLFNDIQRIRREMEDIASAHEVSMGNRPEGVKSGVAIDSLAELDNTQLGPTLMQIENQLSFFCECVLDIMELKYTEPRLLGITGSNLVNEVRSFKNHDLQGNKRIKISLGSALPVGKEARQNFIMMLADKGYISKEKALQLMEFGDLESVFSDIDETAEKSEIQEIIKGNEVHAQAWENHSKRIKVLTDFLMGDEFRKVDPMIQQRFIDHRQEHQNFLSNEMQTMSANQGGQPPVNNAVQPNGNPQ